MRPRTPDAAIRPRPSFGEIVVKMGPWCRFSVDGVSRGISPRDTPLRVAPGEHEVVCLFPGGARLSERVSLAAGERRILKRTLRVKVRIRLRRAEGVYIGDGPLLRSGRDLTMEARRYPMDLVRAGKKVPGGWVTIPPYDCTLSDEPSLVCRR